MAASLSAASLYMDVHVPQSITAQLRLRGVNVLTAFEDNATELPDDQLLERAHSLNRVLFTQDIRFKAMAENWQRQEKSFSGLIYGHQTKGSVGQYIEDLELIIKASEEGEWLNTVFYIPLTR